MSASIVASDMDHLDDILFQTYDDNNISSPQLIAALVTVTLTPLLLLIAESQSI